MQKWELRLAGGAPECTDSPYRVQPAFGNAGVFLQEHSVKLGSTPLADRPRSCRALALEAALADPA
jgi:hypothetical protein